jgi:hypothetical protein
MKATDYESGYVLTIANEEVKDAEPCTLVLMSNKQESLVSRFHDDKLTEADKDKVAVMVDAMMGCLAQDSHGSFIGFVDVDSDELSRKMAIFPAYHADVRDYEFPDPSTAPAYEDIITE